MPSDTNLDSIENLARLMASTALWARVLLGFLESLSDQDFLSRVCAPTPPAGQWIIRLVDDGPARCQLLLNYFEPAELRELLRSEKIVPHDHERDFVTRILSGAYLHWLYAADAGGELKIADIRRVEAGDVYALGAARRHMILEPTEGTTSIAIRGPARLSVPLSEPVTLDPDRARLIRANLMAALSTAPSGPGRLSALWLV